MKRCRAGLKSLVATEACNHEEQARKRARTMGPSRAGEKTNGKKKKERQRVFPLPSKEKVWRIESVQESLDTLLNSSSNILMLIVTKQIEKLSEELREQLKENILNWGRLKASMASLCSGSNVACLAAKTLHIAVVGNATSCTKLFDVEVDPEKQKWLNMLFDGSHTCIFNKMEDMGSSKAYCCVHKKECEVPTGPDGPFLVSCGVSCKDVSKANPKNKEFRSGLQKRKGVTANSLSGFWHYCELHQPPVLILENVIDEFLSDTSNNIDQFKRSFSEIGYAIKHVMLDASMWVPQRRKRVYIIALNMRLFALDEDRARALLGKMVSTIASLSFEAPLSLESFIKEKDHARVKAEKKELQKIAAKRRVGGQEKDVSWPEKQLEEMSRKGTTYSRLQAFRENLRQTLGFPALDCGISCSCCTLWPSRWRRGLLTSRNTTGGRLPRDRLRAKVVQSMWSAR